MQAQTEPELRRGQNPAAVLLLTARDVLEISQSELAAAAGCSEDLICRIESGGLDPALDTVERILNGAALEVRAGPGAPNAHYSGPEANSGEVARLRSALHEARWLRCYVGAPAPGPPDGILPHWDGRDPAPPRPFGVAEGRRDGGGWAALIVRSAIVEARSDIRAFARASGLAAQHLERVASGETRLPTGELAALLTRAGLGLRVRIEVYDDHDDGLHLCSRTDPIMHRPLRRQPTASSSPSRV